MVTSLWKTPPPHTKSHISPSSSLLAQPVLVHFHQLSLNPTNKIISAHMLIFMWETRYQPSTPILPSLSSSAAEMKLLVSASVSVRALGINRCRKNLDAHTQWWYLSMTDIYGWQYTACFKKQKIIRTWRKTPLPKLDCTSQTSCQKKDELCNRNEMKTPLTVDYCETA